MEKEGFTECAESKLVIACSRLAACRGEADSEIRALIHPELDWKLVLTVAGRNGVLPLVATALINNHVRSVPPEIVSNLDLFLQSHTRTNLYLTSQLLRIVRLLEHEGIEVLPFKGPSLAIQAYGNPVLRQFMDLDVLVKPRDFDQAYKVLCQNGYHGNGRAGRVRRSAQAFTQRKDVVLTSPDGMVHLELHWKLSGSHFALPVQISQFWERLERREIGGAKVLSMPFKDLFVYLCLHAARHEWERLGWLTDLLELIESEERQGREINWGETIRHAADHGCERVVRLGLHLLLTFYNKHTVLAPSNNHGEVLLFESITYEVRSRIFARNYIRRSKEQKKAYLLMLQEKESQRAALYLVYFASYIRILFMPNSLDRSVIRLPRILYPLYFLLRPFRLMINYLRGRSVQK